MTLQQLSDILKGFYALQGEAQSITRDDLAKFLVGKGIVIVNEENEKISPKQNMHERPPARPPV